MTHSCEMEKSTEAVQGPSALHRDEEKVLAVAASKEFAVLAAAKVIAVLAAVKAIAVLAAGKVIAVLAAAKGSACARGDPRNRLGSYCALAATWRNLAPQSLP